MIQWRDEVDRFRAEPGTGMAPETWKAFCLAIANMKGYVPKVDQPRPIRNFRCDRCEMEWETGMLLDGILHKALQNNCMGTWREIAEGSQPAPVVASGSKAPLHQEGYEIDDE